MAGSRFLALLFPADCAICGTPLHTTSAVPLCPDCLTPSEPFAAEHCCARCRTPFLNSSPLDDQGLCSLCRLGLTEFDWSWSYALYEGRLRQLIHLFKYGRMRPLARVLGSWLANAYPRLEQFDAIVPLPLHWWKRMRRGFNQSDLLARELSCRVGVPVLNAARRCRRTATQASLTPAQRRDNVQGAFDAAGGRCDNHRVHRERLCQGAQTGRCRPRVRADSRSRRASNGCAPAVSFG